MRKHDFEIYLSSEGLTSQAVSTRLEHAQNAESILGKSLDVVVSDDDNMYEDLHKLKPLDDPQHSHLQNAVRKYYKFCNGKEFPQLKDYHSYKHP